MKKLLIYVLIGLMTIAVLSTAVYAVTFIGTPGQSPDAILVDPNEGIAHWEHTIGDETRITDIPSDSSPPAGSCKSSPTSRSTQRSSPAWPTHQKQESPRRVLEDVDPSRKPAQ